MKQGKIKLVFIIIAVIFLSILMSGILTITPSLEFAGFTWDTYTTKKDCQVGGGGSEITSGGESVNIQSSFSNSGGSAWIETDVTGVDEILVIYEGWGSASCGNGANNNGMDISGSIRGSEGGVVSMGQSTGTSKCPSGGDSVSATFPPAIWKFKNNFDGTWSSLQSLNVGDVFIVKQKSQIKGKPLLQLRTDAGGGCGSSNGYARASLTIYNVVRKENAFALCKADKYAYDLNDDGRIATDGSECIDLKTIVLNSEEAIKESYEEKFARIQQELEAKNQGLSADIEKLKHQLAQAQQTPQTFDDTQLQQKIAQLQAELKETKSILADVQARDKNVLATIEQEEQFKPSFWRMLWQKIANFIKGIINI